MKKHKKTHIRVKTIEEKAQLRAKAEERCNVRRTRKLVDELEKHYGTSEASKEKVDAILKEIQEKDNVRTILCIYYGNYTVDIGEKEVEEKKYNKQKGYCETVKVKKHVILRGRSAAEHYIREKDLNVIVFNSTHAYIKTTKDKAEEIATDLREKIGRCYITKHKKLPAKEEIKARVEKPVETKKSTYNTSERKKDAKAKRKADKKKAAEMRPYYAAWRKGCVNARLKKHNPTLAEKIEKWLKERAAIEAKKLEDNKAHRAKHNQLTTLERKANKYARKEAKRKAAQERRKAQELKRMEYNAKIRKERAQKAQKPVQTELKMAA